MEPSNNPNRKQPRGHERSTSAALFDPIKCPRKVRRASIAPPFRRMGALNMLVAYNVKDLYDSSLSHFSLMIIPIHNDKVSCQGPQ